MYLEWPDGTDDDPTEEKIVDLVLSEPYVILSVNELTFIQTAKREGPPWGHILEYQAHTTRIHYRAKGRPFSFHRVSVALCKYLRGDPTWWPAFRWEFLDLTKER